MYFPRAFAGPAVLPEELPPARSPNTSELHGLTGIAKCFRVPEHCRPLKDPVRCLSRYRRCLLTVFSSFPAFCLACDSLLFCKPILIIAPFSFRWNPSAKRGQTLRGFQLRAACVGTLYILHTSFV